MLKRLKTKKILLKPYKCSKRKTVAPRAVLMASGSPKCDLSEQLLLNKFFEIRTPYALKCQKT